MGGCEGNFRERLKNTPQSYKIAANARRRVIILRRGVVVKKDLLVCRNRRRLFFAVALFFLFAPLSSLYPFDENDILFYASFDKGFDADVARAGSAAALNGKPELVEGHIGKALLFENQASGVLYTAKGNVNAKQGTIAFWVSADNWKGDDGNVFQYYFSTNGSWPVFVVQHLWYRKEINLLLFKGKKLVGGFPAGLMQTIVPTCDPDLVDGAACLRDGVLTAEI